jgi:hypothetical protein
MVSTVYTYKFNLFILLYAARPYTFGVGNLILDFKNSKIITNVSDSRLNGEG